jgi:hypothetical protein
MAAIDLNKLASSAAEAYLQAAKEQTNGHAKDKHPRFGKGAAMAAGVGLTVATRAAYRRVRELDLEQVGTAVENKLKR